MRSEIGRFGLIVRVGGPYQVDLSVVHRPGHSWRKSPGHLWRDKWTALAEQVDLSAGAGPAPQSPEPGGWTAAVERTWHI